MVWGYQLELPPEADGRRKQMRRSGFPSRDEAVAERDQARSLLALAGGEVEVETQIAALLQESRPGKPLPDRDVVARRVRAGVPVTAETTVDEYLAGWLERRRGISEQTRACYANHIELYLAPQLGHIGLQSLRARHIEGMFAALRERNDRIDEARASDDPTVRASVRGVRTLAPASLQRLRSTLRKALNDAIQRDHLLDFNPAVGIELDSGAPPKARVWSAKAIERWEMTGERPSPVMVWAPAQTGRSWTTPRGTTTGGCTRCSR